MRTAFTCRQICLPFQAAWVLGIRRFHHRAQTAGKCFCGFLFGRLCRFVSVCIRVLPALFVKGELKHSMGAFATFQSKDSRKRNPCFFWGCLQRSNPCVIFPRREVLPLIANHLCTFAMCGVSRGPAEQPPPPAASSNCGGHPGCSLHRVRSPAGGRPGLSAPTTPPPRPTLVTPHRGSPVEQPSLTSYPGHLLVPSIQPSGPGHMRILPSPSGSQGKPRKGSGRRVATGEQA